MIFNGVDIKDFAKILKIKRYLMPPIFGNARRIPNKAGSKHINTEIGELFIDVDIGAKRKSKEEIREFYRNIARLLYSDEPQKLIFCDEPNRYYKALINGSTPLWEFVGLSKASLQFICNDPIAYGETKIIDITEIPIHNAGTYPTTGTVTIEITAPATSINVTLQNTGEFVLINDHNFAIGDIVRIDLEEDMVYKNGESIMYDCALESDFFDIPVGEFQVTVSSGNAMLEFTERWL